MTRTVWTFADSAGTVASTAIYSPETDQWQWYQYRFDSNGKVIQSGGDADPALTSVPIVWRGLRQDAISQLYIAGTTVYDATNARFLSQAGMGDGNPYTLDNNRPSSTSPVLVGKLDVDVRPWLDDYVIDPVAGFSTGVAGVVSFGLTDYLQRKLYRSDIYDVNHTGGAYYLGMAAGVGISIGIGGGAAGVAKVSGLASRAGITAQGLTRGLQAYDVVGAGVGAIQSGYNIATTGQIGLLDAIGFVPAVGYGAERLRNLRGLTSSVDTLAPNSGHYDPNLVAGPNPNGLRQRAVTAPTAGEGGVYLKPHGGRTKIGSTGDFEGRYGPNAKPGIEVEIPQTRTGPPAGVDDSAYPWSARAQRRFDEEYIDRMTPPDVRFRAPNARSPVDPEKWERFRHIFGYGDLPSDFGF